MTEQQCDSQQTSPETHDSITAQHERKWNRWRGSAVSSTFRRSPGRCFPPKRSEKRRSILDLSSGRFVPGNIQVCGCPRVRCELALYQSSVSGCSDAIHGLDVFSFTHTTASEKERPWLLCRKHLRRDEQHGNSKHSFQHDVRYSGSQLRSQEPA